MEIVYQASTSSHHVFITSSFCKLLPTLTCTAPQTKRNTEGEGENCEKFDADANKLLRPRSILSLVGYLHFPLLWVRLRSHSTSRPSCHSRVCARTNTVSFTPVGGEFGGGAPRKMPIKASGGALHGVSTISTTTTNQTFSTLGYIQL